MSVSPTDGEIERAQKEYEHVVAELARYHSDSQKLVSLVSLVLTLAFAIGVAQKIDAVFPLIPLVTLTLFQYLLANNYDYRVREQYVHGLEIILQQEGRSVPALYHSQIRHYFFELRWWEFAFLPFNGAVLYTSALLLAVSLFSLARSYRYLSLKPHWLLIGYVTIALVMVVHTLGTAIWSSVKLRSGSAWPTTPRETS
jgi:hypothetical protein